MHNESFIQELTEQAETGIVPILGDLNSASEILGFAFGLYFDSEGQLGHPGPVNEAIANFILGHEVLRTKNMSLQEEIAIAVEAVEPSMANQISTLKTINTPFNTFGTREIMWAAHPGFVERGVDSLIVLAFRHHLPRARAQVAKAGYGVITPDMGAVGDFDSGSSQEWIRNSQVWIERERGIIRELSGLGEI